MRDYLDGVYHADVVVNELRQYVEVGVSLRLVNRLHLLLYFRELRQGSGQ